MGIQTVASNPGLPRPDLSRLRDKIWARKAWARDYIDSTRLSELLLTHIIDMLVHLNEAPASGWS